MVGAIKAVSYSYRDDVSIEEWKAVRKKCRDTVLDTVNRGFGGRVFYRSVERWNDSMCTSKSDIFEVLDKAIDRSRVEEVIAESKDVEIRETVTV